MEGLVENMNNIIMGFEFDDTESYNLAKKELDYINRLKENMNINHPDSLLEVYNRLINDEFFKTPVGMEFLRGMQKELYANKVIDNSKIRSIPAIVYNKNKIVSSSNEKVEQRTDIIESKVKNVTKGKSKYRDLYIKMLIINVALVLTILVMFAITKRADKFDADYYRESIEDSYVNWQNELDERESSINSRENGS